MQGVTGNVLDTDVHEYLEAGADMVMGKPLKMASLESLLLHLKEKGPKSQYPLKLHGSQGTTLDWVPLNSYGGGP